MHGTEEALAINCQGERLQAVLSRPANARDTGIVIVVGGPQYRAGSHRQFVLLARRLVSEGWPVLRFDVRGMGDAGGEARSFEALNDDIAAAVGALLQAIPALRRVVLYGLCDGASAALLYCRERSDPRIAGLCLLNPWLRSPATLARTHVKHYYLQRLRQPEFWKKLLSGKVPWQAISGLFGNVRAAAGADTAAAPDFRTRMAAGWAAFDGSILLLMSGADLTAREFDDGTRSAPAWQGAWSRPGVQRFDIEGADHTLSDRSDRLAAEAAILKWLVTAFTG